MKLRYLLLSLVFVFPLLAESKAAGFFISGDTLFLESGLASGDTTFALVSPDSISADQWQQLEAKNFQCIKIGKKIYRNPVFSLVHIQDKNKLVAVVLAILTGPLGGHRLYLGTKPIVPVVYTLTLGGGFFILPFIDIVMLLFSKDISRFENNDHIFMWLKD